MKKIIAATIMILASSVTVNAMAGNGSGNPKNDDYYYVKPNPTPVMIWKDGSLVRNPAYFDANSLYMKK